MIEEQTLEQHLQQTNELQEKESKTAFGFWVYLMTDCVLFASLFAVYAVLHNNTFGGEPGNLLFSLPYVLTETMILLTSSFTCGLGALAARRNRIKQVYVWFVITFVLGASFLIMEVHEFHDLDMSGNSWRRSGFLSSYFTLVGTHGLHITVGLLWLVVILVGITRRGLKPGLVRKINLFSTFWHFLDLIWIFIFTIVYLMGAIQR